MENRFNVIKDHFEKAAKLFDKNFTRFAPHYEEAIQALVSVLPNVVRFGLGTGSKSIKNINFYQKLGYKINGEEKDNNVILVRMEKNKRLA